MGTVVQSISQKADMPVCVDINLDDAQAENLLAGHDVILRVRVRSKSKGKSASCLVSLSGRGQDQVTVTVDTNYANAGRAGRRSRFVAVTLVLDENIVKDEPAMDGLMEVSWKE